MTMSVYAFSDAAAKALAEAVDQFGSYNYYDKGASEVMDVDALAKMLGKLDDADVIIQLEHLAQRTDLRVDTDRLVTELLGCVEDRDGIFESEILAKLY